jgi:hypothetical protein
MIGSSDSNRREGQGGEPRGPQHERSPDQRHDRRNTNRQRGRVRAMSVLGNAKSKSHRKTHQVEPDGTGRKFMHLTRGDLARESAGEVSRGRSSEDSRRKAAGAKGRRIERATNVWSKPRSQLKQVGAERNSATRATSPVEAGGFRSERGRSWRGTPQAQRHVLEGSTAGCGKPHVRWCGSPDGRNPVRATRSTWRLR